MNRQQTVGIEKKKQTSQRREFCVIKHFSSFPIEENQFCKNSNGLKFEKKKNRNERGHNFFLR